jgi:hypothetical protein
MVGQSGAPSHREEKGTHPTDRRHGAGGLTLFCQSFGEQRGHFLEMPVPRAVAQARFPSIHRFANIPRTDYGWPHQHCQG